MKNLFASLFAISFVVNIALAYIALDSDVRADDMGNEITYRETQMAGLEKILPPLLSEVTKEDVLDAAKQENLEVLVKQEDGGIYIAQSGFLFSNDKVSSIALK